MHYRNGREAKNGDQIVKLGYDNGKIEAAGTLRDARSGNDYCNGHIMPFVTCPSDSLKPKGSDPIACMCDCLHVEDVAAILAEKGLDKRPVGK